jgi:predicted Zn-ribbon and HTH transcriptional regulator/very-short-patch-repair endonuclease
MSKKDELIKLVNELEDYEIVNENIVNNKILIKHITCNTIWEVNIYNFINGSRCPNCKINKIKKTVLEKYGVSHYSKTPEFKSKISNTWNKKPQSEINEMLSKMKNTMIKRYSVDNPTKNAIIKKKINDSKKRNFIINKIKKYTHVTPLFDIEEYNGIKKYYNWKCNKCGYEFEWSIQQNRPPICRKCFPDFSTSNIEINLSNYFIGLKNKRFYYNGKQYYELDLYFPDKNIGIEINGNYWHSELNGKDKHYHINKTLYFEDQGIQVLHFFEDEIIFKKSIVKSIIKSKLGLIINKIYARNTVIKEVSSKDAKEFLDNNHLQGSINSSIKLGLYYKDHLVSIMTFGKSRYNKNYKYELLRFANKCNINVIGGFSKLLKYFINTYSPKSIITYADRRFSNGNVYEKNGFTFLHNTNVNYYYIDKKNYQIRYNRMLFQKHKLSNKLKLFNPELTEWENMQLNNYDRIWDCGNKTYTLLL